MNTVGRFRWVQFGVSILALITVVGYGGSRALARTHATTPVRQAAASRANDIVAQAKAAVAIYAGPQTTWLGPASAPKIARGMKVVYLSGDEQNDISHEYGVYMQQAAAKIGWQVTVIDGKGSPTTWLSGMNQAIALKPNGIVMFADAASLQDPIRKAVAQGIKWSASTRPGCPGRSRNCTSS